MKKQQGFTLIELMIVVAIIAILAAIALPAYADYMKKSKVSEVILAASSMRTSISEYVASNNDLPPDDWDADAVFTPTQYVSDLQWNGSRIVATAQGIASDINGQTIELTPDSTQKENGIVAGWECGGSIPSKYRPGSCSAAAGESADGTSDGTGD